MALDYTIIGERLKKARTDRGLIHTNSMFRWKKIMHKIDKKLEKCYTCEGKKV